jgi:hypothetical protein
VTADAQLAGVAAPGSVLLMSTALRWLVVASAVAVGLVCQFLVQRVTMKVINMEIVTEIAPSLVSATIMHELLLQHPPDS